jgi:hypothetical protein
MANNLTNSSALEAAVGVLDWAGVRTALLKREFAVPDPARSEEIETFERRWSIRLPDTYRQFLMVVGNGGPGPLGGIYPLGHELDLGDDRMMPLSNESCARLREPFLEDAADRYFDERGDVRDELEDDALAEFEFVITPPGVLPVAFGAGSVSAWMVVNGRRAGQMWESESGVLTPIATPLCRFVSFFEWYAAWLLVPDSL